MTVKVATCPPWAAGVPNGQADSPQGKAKARRRMEEEPQQQHCRLQMPTRRTMASPELLLLLPPAEALRSKSWRMRCVAWD